MEKTISKKILPYKDFPKGFNVLLYNDEIHQMDEVVEALKIIGCSEKEAAGIAFFAHKSGMVIVKTEQDRAFARAMIRSLRTSGLQVELYEI